MGSGALIALVVTNPWVMTQVLGILVLVVLPSLYFGRRVRKLSRASQDRVADSSAIAAEVLNAIPVVQSYVQERREAQRFDASTEAAFETARKRTKVRALLVGFIITATFGALLWGLYQGTQAVAEGRITAGHLGQTVVFVIILVSSVAVLSEVYGDLLRAAGATERLMELLAERSPVADPPQPVALPPVQGGSSLAFEHVTFHYPSRPKQASLADFTLQVRPGETVALVGPSGCGKTTLCNLIPRFYNPTSGRVLIDGVDARSYKLRSLRERISIVPQDAVLFSGTIADNLRYGRPEASQAEVEAAAKVAHAHGFIMDLPEGYQTHLGEAGLGLSGGQRQRTTIARALVNSPQLILADEPTGALDSVTSLEVMKLFKEVHKEGMTMIVVTHENDSCNDRPHHPNQGW